MKELAGRVAVVTGGANGIGRGLVEALLEAGAKVVIADIEAPVLEATLADLAGRGDIAGLATDVSDPASVEGLADFVYERHGACHLLFNNAGVTSGGGGKPWEQEINDFRWCLGVNVFGVANGVLTFVPRMIASGEPGHIINTSSGDGGFAPVPNASIYATSKAAVSCYTEALAHNFVEHAPQLKASIFYPSGGFLETGLWTAPRNRPADLARMKPRPPAPMTTMAEFREALAKAGRPVEAMDLLELGRFVLQGVKDDKFIISHNLNGVGALLRARAAAIESGDLPPHALKDIGF